MYDSIVGSAETLLNPFEIRRRRLALAVLHVFTVGLLEEDIFAFNVE